MTAAPARTPAVRHATAGPRLTDLLGDLGRLGLHARTLTDSVAGEPDVRLHAWRDDDEVTVELLWRSPGAPAPAPARPEAVRVAGDARTVWRCGHGRCTSADMVRFVCDLLLLDEDALSQRHRRLG